jgi:hypothetical protein
MTMLLLAGALIATTPPAQSPPQSPVAGEWNAEMNTPGGVRSFKLLLKVDGEKVTGTVKREAGDVPLEGTLKGDDLTFAYTVSYNDNPLTITVSVKVAGDTMKGTVDFAGAAQDEFAARKVPPKPGG